MREQVQDTLDQLTPLGKQQLPKAGWIATIRKALGMTSAQLAKRLDCSQTNITAFERREKTKTITLETLEQVAKAMNCHLIYCFIPEKPLDQILQDQAKLIAKRRLRSIGHSMSLEQQGLNPQQQKRLEDIFVQELLQTNLKGFWE